MPFNVINIDTGAPICNCADGAAFVYATGKDAAEAAKVFSDTDGVRYQPRRIPSVDNVDWRERERKRFETGVYLPVPWASDSPWWREHESVVDKVKDHFVHASTEEPGKLAFTASEEHGQQDRQTRMRPGKYLKAFFGELLNERNIRILAGRFAQQYETIVVKFADTADDIERVYTNGPESCMSKDASSYSSSVHPVRVYAAGDLAVAYLEHEEDGISARCVCWPEKKRYARIYGDEVRLCHALDALGYVSGSMRVARLLAIEEDNGAYVVPYVDSISNAERKGEYLILGRGSISCSETNGLNVCGAQCDCCGRHYDDENEGGYLEGRGESVCDSCYSENTFYCDRYQETREGDSSDYVTMADGDTWCNEAFEQYGAECDATGENLPADQCVTLEDGTVWSKEYFAKHGYQCQGCRCLFANGDDCGNGCDPEAVEHAMPRLQGRDEHPDQIEMPLVPPQSLAVPRGLKVGDRVRVLSGGYAGQVPDGAIADITCVYGPGFEVDGWYFTRKELEFVSSPVLELEAA